MTTSLALEAVPEAPAVPPLSVSVVAESAVTAHRIAGALETGGMVVLEPRPGEAYSERLKPDVVVLSLEISRPENLGKLRGLRRQMGDAGIVVVAMGADSRNFREALNVGADGFIMEADLESSLAAVARAVAVGHVCVPRRLRRGVVRPAFSHRERQVLALVVKGLQNRQIAEQLFLAESTIKCHLSSSFTKLGVRSRKEAAALLLDPDEGLQALVLGHGLDDSRAA